MVKFPLVVCDDETACLIIANDVLLLCQQQREKDHNNDNDHILPPLTDYQIMRSLTNLWLVAPNFEAGGAVFVELGEFDDEEAVLFDRFGAIDIDFLR